MKKIYRILLKTYGPRGWWPVASRAAETGFDARGYHPGIYDLPPGNFEIIAGAVLTQNTNWQNVEKALGNLRQARVLTPDKILALSREDLGELIRPSGYFNQKARKLKVVARFFKERKNASREELLSLWGVGEETADSILLYAFRIPVFVVDAYTKRIFSRLGFFPEKTMYKDAQNLFHQNLKRDSDLFNEYHALIVEHAKVFCRKKPLCSSCPLDFCPEKASGII